MIPFGLWVKTMLGGRLVGRDEFGNRYYCSRASKGQREKRWVIYKGAAEASKVPPLWHAWLHKTTNAVPPAEIKRLPWQKPHQPNQTGTKNAFRPAGHTLKGGQRPAVSGDYQAWTPNS